MTDVEALDINTFFQFIAQPEQRADPYPFYETLRSRAPVWTVPEMGLCILSSYAHVSDVLRDPRFSSDERNGAMWDPDNAFESSTFGKISRTIFLFRDDPDHKRIRDLVQKAFTRRIVEDLRGRIEGLVDGLLEAFVSKGGGDLMDEFAYPVPITVICELIGIPVEDRAVFGGWAKDFATRFEIQPLRTAEQEARADAATDRLIEYFDELIESKRRDPQDDLLSSLVAVEEAGDKLTHTELLATCLLLLLAGFETTANLIGNGTHALMRNRDQWDRLVADPELARSAVEELLRYDSPVQLIQRITLEDVTIGKEQLPKGYVLGVMLAAANRDPSAFEEPNRLDLTRGGSPLVSFGGGVHFCLGAPLARLEAQTAFAALARYAPDLELAGEPSWRSMFVLRGLDELPVRTN